MILLQPFCFICMTYTSHQQKASTLKYYGAMAFPPNSRTGYTMHLMKIVSIRCKNPFSWKYFATSRGKGIVDGISGRLKSLLLQNVMRKSTGWLIVQNAEEFATTAKALMEKLRVFFVRQNEVEEFKGKINFFQETITNVTKSCHKFVLLTKILQHLEFYERKHELDSTHDQNILT